MYFILNNLHSDQPHGARIPIMLLWRGLRSTAERVHQGINSCNPLSSLSRKPRKVKGLIKVTESASGNLTHVRLCLASGRVPCSSSKSPAGSSEPHGSVSGAWGIGGRQDLPFACFLCGVLETISKVGGFPLQKSSKTPCLHAGLKFTDTALSLP